MKVWSGEIKELKKYYKTLKGQVPDLEKELAQLVKAEDEIVVLVYSRRCLEIIVTDLCEKELGRQRKTEPLKGVIDKLNKEEKVPSFIITSILHLNSLSTYGAHPKEFDPRQVRTVLINLLTIIEWYLKYKNVEPESAAEKKEKEPDIITEDKDFSLSDRLPKLEKSIAVLPFVDMSPEKDQEYFCDGMTEEIINVLTHVESLKVIARTSSFVFKDKHEDIREIGKKLDVETLLEGSVRKVGNRLRITAQLVKVADGSHLWSERFDREMKDVFAIQDEISLAIVDNLKVKLLGKEKAAILKRYTEDLEAYNLHLKGNYYCQMLTIEGFDKAIEYFEQALQKDPHYALAYTGLASVFWYSSYWGNVPPNEAYPKAKEYAKKALEIDDTLAEAHASLGFINMNYDWNWKAAEREFKQALQLNPNSALIHIYYFFLLILIERYDEAIAEAKRASKLDPLSSYINTHVGSAFFWAGQYDRAIDELRMTITINPNYFLANLYLGHAYRGKSMLEEAIAEYEKAVELSGGVPIVMTHLAISYYEFGKKAKAEKLFDSLNQRSRDEYVPPICFYLIHKVQGDQDKEFEWLERACNEHDSCLPWFRVFPIDIDRIPDEPRFKALLKKAGLE